MLTGRLFQGVLVDTKATNVVAPMDLNALEVCSVSDVPFVYPIVPTITGALCATEATDTTSANNGMLIKRTMRLE